MPDVVVLVLDGVLDSALSVTVDVLGAANRLARGAGRAAPFAVRVLGPRRSRVTTGSGYGREVDGAFGPGRIAADVVIVPGLDAPRPADIDAMAAASDFHRAAAWLRRAHDRGALVLASCTATFLLAHGGLLEGRAATTSWYLAPHFRRSFPGVDLREDAMVVPSGRVVTAGAALSHVDLVLWLLRRTLGPDETDRCARFLVLDDRPTQARYMALEHLGTRSPEIRRAERFLRRNLDRPIALAEIARAAGTSPRTLARRFEEAVGLSPIQFLRRLRAERAQHLLETTRQSVTEVAEGVGYADPITLRRLLRKEIGRSAREVRARVRAR